MFEQLATVRICTSSFAALIGCSSCAGYPDTADPPTVSTGQPEFVAVTGEGEHYRASCDRASLFSRSCREGTRGDDKLGFQRRARLRRGRCRAHSAPSVPDRVIGQAAYRGIRPLRHSNPAIQHVIRAIGLGDDASAPSGADHLTWELLMSQLRSRTIEDMQIRNLTLNTQRAHVVRFARHFRKSPERFGRRTSSRQVVSRSRAPPELPEASIPRSTAKSTTQDNRQF